MAKVDKVLVTHKGSLQAKYGADYTAKVLPALDALIASDKARGLTTRLVRLDNATDMAKVSGTAVANAASARQHKAAIDAVFNALTPDYVCIVGAPDVVPHQPLVNPIASDGDATAWSDLPYACAAPYSTRIDRFLAPTRVVGRLPDLTGATSAAYLVKVLAHAAAAQSFPPAAFATYLGVTAKVWTASTAQSLVNAFGNSTDMKAVPSAAPPWPGIGRRSHFINCHGATADPRFYGQQGTSYPVAHDAAKLAGLAKGTVAAMECCYGAELYDPGLANGQAGICNTYLARGAYGYFGSSTIAYGPASGNGQADLICQFFIRHILAGASTGEAALRARLDFIQLLSVADPTDLKTIAQFNLMGDPSLHPLDLPPPHDATVAGAPAKTKSKAASSSQALRAVTRPMRRRHLAAVAEAVGSLVAPVDTRKRTVLPAGARAFLERTLRREGARKLEVSAYTVRHPRLPGPAEEMAPVVHRVDVAVGELPRHKSAPFRRFVVIVARQAGAQMIVRRSYSR
jgi:hypothetical protein